MQDAPGNYSVNIENSMGFGLLIVLQESANYKKQ